MRIIHAPTALAALLATAAASAQTEPPFETQLEYIKYQNACLDFFRRPDIETLRETAEYQWCYRLLDRIGNCRDLHPLNPLREYTDREMYEIELKVIECTAAAIDF